MVFKRLNRDSRGTHRNDLLTGLAGYGDHEIDAFALACTAERQEDSEKSDPDELIVPHMSLLHDAIV